jgi:hypothetical protein
MSGGQSGHGGRRTAGPERALGRPSDPDPVVPKTLRLRRAQWAWLKDEAKRMGMSLNSLVASLVQDRIGE